MCLLHGQRDPHVMPHSVQVAQVKSKWGEQVPCNIGVSEIIQNQI